MKFDARTGKFYYINHYTKTTTWEDPRDRYQQIGKAGSKEKENTRPGVDREEAGLHQTSSMAPLANQQVASMRRELEAEQESRNQRASSPLNGRSNTPQMGYAGAHSSLGRLQLDTTDPYDSPLPSQRSTLRRDSHILAEISEIDSNFTSQEAVGNDRISKRQDTAKLDNFAAMRTNRWDDLVNNDQLKSKKKSQFQPLQGYQIVNTAYTNNFAAMRASQPESNNLIVDNLTTAIGLDTENIHMDESNALNELNDILNNLNHTVQEYDQDSMNNDPDQPVKMETLDLFPDENNEKIVVDKKSDNLSNMTLQQFKDCRYLKSVFPTVEEYLLLDVLANSENNVQKTADKLSKMGYVRRETPAAPRLHAKRKEEERLAEKRTPLPKPPPIKTEKEKADLRRKMKEKYEKKFNIPERILFMALESVLFDEDQANNLIQSMIEDDMKRQKAKEAEKARERAEKKKSPKPMRKVVEAERPKPSSPKRVPRQTAAAQDKRGFSKQNVKIYESETTDGSKDTECRSLAKGPNPALRKGPNDDLLLTDYVTWNGPNASLRKGANASVAKGPNPANRRGPSGSAGAKGPNPENRKGPQGLAKGSIYSSFKAELPPRAN